MRRQNQPVDKVDAVHECVIIQCCVEYQVVHAAVPSGLACTVVLATAGESDEFCAKLWRGRWAWEECRICEVVIPLGVEDVVGPSCLKG
jgi:hypothetical protein